MRRCLRGKIISLSLVGLGSFLMGASLGLALGKDDEEYRDLNRTKPYSFADTDGDRYIHNTSGYLTEVHSTEEEIAYKRRVREIYPDASTETLELLEEDFDEEDEIIDSTPYLNDDGVLVKDTTEGLVEVKEPYIISEDEFMDPNIFVEFERETLIYYEEDDVLTTERDEVVKNVDEMIGPDALTSFGYMSGNKDTVFVRNTKLGLNLEVIREKGSYQELVLGFQEDDVDYEKAKKFFKDLDDDGR